MARQVEPTPTGASAYYDLLFCSQPPEQITSQTAILPTRSPDPPAKGALGDRQAEGLGGPEIDHQLERPERLTLTLHVRRRSRSSSTAATKSCTLIGLPWYASNPAPNLLPVLAHHGRGRPFPRRDLETPRMGDKWSSDSRAIRRVSASSAAQDACHWTAARPCSRITDSPPIW
jgi:hypothetical protein